MNADVAPCFPRGVRLRREANGSAVLLVPEGIVRLNGSAAAALALVDGTRTVAEIIAQLCGGTFDATQHRIAEDVATLFERLRERHLITC